MQMVRAAHGQWVPGAGYRKYESGESDRALDFAFALGVRPIANLEVAGSIGYGSETVRLTDYYGRRGSVSDATLRARYEIVQEPSLTYPDRTAWPAIGVSVGARLPTGSVDRVQANGPSTGTVGSTATSQGLGTTELSAAVDVRKTWGSLQVAGIGEAAYRFADESLGRPRQLGPRLLARALVLGFVSEEITVGGFVDIGWEGPIGYDGKTVADTHSRISSVGASGSLKLEGGFRSGLSLTYNPPLSFLGENATGTAGLLVFVGYAR